MSDVEPISPENAYRLLRYMSIFDSPDDIHWRAEDGGYVSAHAMCNDLFASGGSDCEPIRNEDVQGFIDTYEELEALDAPGSKYNSLAAWWACSLWVARRRQQWPKVRTMTNPEMPVKVRALFQAIPSKRPSDL